MKLYTEEQVIQVFEKYGNMSAINARNIIDLSESIEIPSDEEINDEFNVGWSDYQNGCNYGAKWMRNKILDQNK